MCGRNGIPDQSEGQNRMATKRDQDERGQANDDAFLGGLLGMAIGDALGMPANGRAGRPDPNWIGGYLPLTRADGTIIDAGEFTDETEFALSIVEVATTDRGRLDPDLIGPRLVRLEQGDSGHWQDATTRSALHLAAESLVFQVPLDEDGPVSAGVASRGMPVGLLASVGDLQLDALRTDSDLVARLTHGSPAQASSVAAVAFVTQLAARQSVPSDDWFSRAADVLRAGAMHDVLRGLAPEPDLAVQLRRLATGSAEQQIAASMLAVIGTSTFDEAVLAAVNAGGPSDAIGAIAGTVAGAYRGAGDIPQWLIDGLGGRIYVSLAAPWFRRAARYRAGVVKDLPMDGGPPPPRPMLPPRR